MAIGVGAAKTGSNGGKAGSSDQEVRCGELQWHLSFSDALVSDRGGGADGLNRPVGGLAGLIHYYLHTQKLDVLGSHVVFTKPDVLSLRRRLWTRLPVSPITLATIRLLINRAAPPRSFLSTLTTRTACSHLSFPLYCERAPHTLTCSFPLYCEPTGETSSNTRQSKTHQAKMPSARGATEV